MKFIAKNLADTARLANSLAMSLCGGEIILLAGELGAGKTTFTKALAKSLGVSETLTSPTFTYMKEYLGRFPLYHFDLYRVEEEDEVYELGLSEYFGGEGISVIEWNKFTKFPTKPIVINIKNLGDTVREFEVLDCELQI